jgi:ribosomal protein S18 acetylase RimI-like enzyme
MRFGRTVTIRPLLRCSEVVSTPGRRLDWDSAFFDVPIGTAEAETPADIDAIEEWAERERIRCLYLLVAAHRLDATQAAERRGYFLTGVRVTCMRDAPQRRAPARDGSAVGIREARASDIPVLQQIAANAHQGTRFYADPHFARESCVRLYETWIRRSCEGWADHVLAAERHGRVVGYASLHLSEGQGVIGLCGVASDARQMGVGRALVGEALEWFVQRAVACIRVATQAQNTAALRLYQDAGFSIAQADMWLHKWR